MAKEPAVKWTREHFLIALNLYCKLPFGKLDRKNPIIVEVATKMGRSPSSLAMKLVNFAALDPVQQARGIRGLSGATKQDKAMWNEFHAHLAQLGPDSEQLLHDLFTKDETEEVDFLARNEVRCCISGINVPPLLVASHIKPWRACRDDERLSLRNGLCLSSIHDAAFDAGLICLDYKLAVVLGKRLRSFFPQPALEQSFVPFEGKVIRLPSKLAEPDPAFLAYHREFFERVNR